MPGHDRHDEFPVGQYVLSPMKPGQSKPQQH
jgi:hypothetical protein